MYRIQLTGRTCGLRFNSEARYNELHFVVEDVVALQRDSLPAAIQEWDERADEWRTLDYTEWSDIAREKSGA